MPGFRLIAPVICLFSLVFGSGCDTRQGVCTQLPDPVFGAARPKPRPQPLRPQPVVQAPVRTVGFRDIPAAWYPPGAERRWRAIVIHHSADENGGAQRYDQAHRNRGWDELGYHFIIGNGSDTGNGVVEVGSRWRKQKHGAHCKTPDNFYNEYGIGICLVGNFENHPPSEAQLASLRKLLLFLMNRYDLGAGQIYGHGEVGRTACPGRQMPLSNLRHWAGTQTQIWAGSL